MPAGSAASAAQPAGTVQCSISYCVTTQHMACLVLGVDSGTICGYLVVDSAAPAACQRCMLLGQVHKLSQRALANSCMLLVVRCCTSAAHLHQQLFHCLQHVCGYACKA
jgi:hypothetical protein